MALIRMGSLMSDATFSLDVTAQNRVSGIQCVNNWVWPVLFQVGTGMPMNVVWSRTLAPGETITQNIPNNRRFDFDGDLADWGLSMTPQYG
jgi:hypothetical protein